MHLLFSLFSFNKLRNYSLCLFLSTVCVMMTISSSMASDRHFQSGDWAVLYGEREIAIGGTIVIKINRFDVGNFIIDTLHLEYQDPLSYEWVEFARIDHWKNAAQSNFYSTHEINNENVYFENYSQSGRLGVDHFYVAEWTPKMRLANQKITIRARENQTHISTKEVQFYGIEAPSNFSVSFPESDCEIITLNWKESRNVGGRDCGYYVYANDVRLSPVVFKNDFSVEGSDGYRNYTYTHQPLTHAEQEYKVVPLLLDSYEYWVPDANELKKKSGLWDSDDVFKKHNYTFPLSTKIKQNPKTPENFQASFSRCDSIIKLTWEIPAVRPESFRLYYKEEGALTESVLFISNDESNSYDFKYPSTATKGIEFRLRAADNCPSINFSDYTQITKGDISHPLLAPSNLSTSTTANSVVLTWDDNSTNEKEFMVIRSQLSTGVRTEYKLDSNSVTFEDKNIKACEQYEYAILAVNDCEEVVGSGGTAQLNPDLSTTFNLDDFKVSTGYFSDKTKLEWTAKNRNIISGINVYRKKLSQGALSPDLVATLDENSSIWYDKNTEGGVLYAYSLKAFTLCVNDTVWSNEIIKTGFRSPTGVVTGNVQFDGGFAVKDVAIRVANNNGTTGNSLLFDGLDDSVFVSHKSSLMPSDSFTIELLIKPLDLSKDFYLFSKEGIATGYGLKYTSSNSSLDFYVYDQTNVLNTVSASSLLTVNNYSQITAVFARDSLHLYKDGVKEASKVLNSTLATNNEPLVLGSDGKGANYFHGHLDEVRIWSKAKINLEISRDYNRILNGSEEGLIAYWSLDEGLGGGIYDFAHDDDTQLFYAHDGFIHGAQWSVDIPSSSQLLLKAYTDINGNYVINNIRFKGSGDTFSFTPYFGQHQFNPNTKLLYIGEGALVHNGIDFKDISSFRVTGTVNFYNSSCFLKGAFLYIDDQLAIRNGKAVETDASGFFELNVPIGNHRISVAMDKHTFSVGQFPTDGSTYYFDKPITGLSFVDSTFVKVVGRAVGGILEGNKKIGFGLSQNNIGKTSITFESEQGSGCYTKTMITDSASGEYVIYLPPLRYIIDNTKVLVLNNPSVSYPSQSILDLTNFGLLKKEEYQVDSTAPVQNFYYHVKRDFIYRATPDMSVTEVDGSELIGENSYEYTNPFTDSTSLIDLTSKPFIYPVFYSDKLYSSKIAVFEAYVNKDTGKDIITRSPVTDAELIITNNLGASEETAKWGGADYIKLNSLDGDTIYSFRVHSPNTFLDITRPINSFTATLEIKIEINRNSYVWKPNGETYRAYVFGAKAIGSTFFTTGPQIVTNILRDPPGDNSYSYLEEGTVSETVNSWEVNTKNKAGIVKTIKTGTKFSIGGGIIGPSLETDIKINATSKTKGIINAKSSGEYQEKITITNAWQTDRGPEQTSYNADLFLGKAQNFLFGASSNVTLIPDTLSIQGGGTLSASDSLLNINGEKLRIGIKAGYYVLPQGFDTYFSYPVHHIEEVLIPSIVKLRNNLFVKSALQYVSKIPASNPLYGSNNDDTRWLSLVSSSTPLVSDSVDRDGPSYTYTPKVISSSEAQMDSIRWYNQQIRLWEEALKRNEKEKIESEFVKNISYTGSEISSSIEVAKDTVYKASFEVGIAEDLEATIGATIGGVGGTVKTTLEMELTTGGEFTRSSSASTKYGYVLHDEDHNDFYSIDIRKAKIGSGPIFKLIGGQSKCPWEQEAISKYYEPGKHQISSGSAHREVPVIGADTKTLIGIPEDEGAIFKIKLSNASEAEDTQWYAIRVVDDVTGVVFRLDGAHFSVKPVIFEVKPNTTIEKELTVYKSGNTYKHDDIRIMFYSTCEWAIHTNGGHLVSTDTLKLGVEFIQSCSDVNIKLPTNQWISNSLDSSKQKIQINSYDITDPILNKINLQYKPKTKSTWVNLNTFYKDTTGIDDANKELLDPNGISAVNWDQSQLVDANYDLRAVSVCAQDDDYSAIHTGVLDRVNPRAFGSPQPADGVLDPNDDIVIQFNETVNAGKLTWNNFDVRGKLNGGVLNHQASLLFDGIDDYLRIPRGVNLFNTSFTVEAWAKRLKTGEEAILSQGNSNTQGFWYGFDSQDHFMVEINGVKLVSDNAYKDNLWHHWAFTYDYGSNQISLFLDGALLKTVTNKLKYTGNGTIYLAKRNYVPTLNFKGNIHELRVWRKARTNIDLGRDMNVSLTGREEGLIGYWTLDESEGSLALDKVHNRNAIHTANWSLNPSGQAMLFDGVDDVIEVDAGSVIFNRESDFTIELWFKSDSRAKNTSLFSNGKADAPVSNTTAWEIAFNSSGHLEFINNTKVFKASDKSYLDNQWHHLALVVRRLANTTLYIDGEAQNSISSDDWQGFGGPLWGLGAKTWIDFSSIKHSTKHFVGYIDDFRVWKLARKQSQIKSTKNFRLQTDEIGLLTYIPFENYVLDASVLVLKPRLDEVSPNTLTTRNQNGASFTALTAPVKLDLPVEKVNYNYVVNDDEIYFEIQESTQRIQNASLDISVKDVEDLYSNKQQSAETWSVFVDQNQVKWESKLFDIEKEVYKPYEWIVEINNRGGKYENFNINNLPVWLEANPSSGIIAPRSNQKINLKINEGLNVGYYTQDIYCKTSDYDEKLSLSVRVYAQEPDWDINPSDYQFSMSVIGKLSIDDIISDDPNDILGAFVNDTCRGKVSLRYLSHYDQSLAFLDIYSNKTSGEKVEFRIWDADKGYVYYDVSPNYIFQEGDLKGRPNQPVVFSATNGFVRHISLEKGWKWTSFNLSNVQNKDVNKLLSPIQAKNGDIIKSQTFFDQYDSQNGWLGSLSANGGVRNTEMYMLQLSEAQDLRISGREIEVDTSKIIIKKGWNWLPYLPQINLTVSEALADLQVKSGSLIKGQKGFAVYDDKLGWLGSLSFMKPGEGYMYYSDSLYDFYYPSKGFLSSARVQENEKQAYTKVDAYEDPFNMNFIAKVDELIDVDKLHLVVKNGEKIKGEAERIRTLNQELFFLTASGQNLDSLHFALVDEKGIEILIFENQFFFNANSRVGSIEEPYVLKTSSKKIPSELNVYPNPFTDKVRMEFQTIEDGEIEITISDIVGRKIKNIKFSSFRKGLHQFIWDGKNSFGEVVSEGIYFISISSASKSEKYKVIKKHNR